MEHAFFSSSYSSKCCNSWHCCVLFYSYCRPNEYKTRNIEVVNDNIYYDGFQPIVYIYNNNELEKFRPYNVVYSASAKKPVVIEVTSTNDGIIALGDYYRFKVLLIPKK